MPITVLLVEDEPAIRQLMAQVLALEGFRVFQARHGAEALDVYRAHGDAVDLLITDVRMPFLSDIGLVDELRQRRPTLKVLFITGYPSDRTANDYQLVKPFTRDDFVATIQEILSATMSE
jgi:DNA-binding NtrC family response regulator